jgi:hypothetical protein
VLLRPLCLCRLRFLFGSLLGKTTKTTCVLVTAEAFTQRVVGAVFYSPWMIRLSLFIFGITIIVHGLRLLLLL